jgi:hypothetical protein
MLPIDSAGGPGGRVVPAQAVPQQAVPHGGRFVRPGALVWGGTRAAPDGAYSSCEQVEQLVAAGRDAGRSTTSSTS